MPQNKDLQWGSAAVGTSGPVTVELDEALNGDAEAWNLKLDSPTAYLSVRLDNRGQISEVLNFLQNRNEVSCHCRMAVGTAGAVRVEFVRDDETPGRFFVRLTGPSHELHLTFVPTEAAHVTAALGQAVAQLQA